MKITHEFQEAGAGKSNFFAHHTDSALFADMMWADDDCDDLGVEFGQRIDNRGRRIYQVLADM